jgi:hypothetical protein
MDWINLSQDREEWWIVLNVAETTEFAFLQNIQTSCGAHPAFCLVSTRVYSQSGQSMSLTTRPSSAELKNGWSLAFAPSTYLHGVNSDNFDVFWYTLCPFCVHVVQNSNDMQCVTQWLLNVEPWYCTTLCKGSSLEGCQQ